MNDVRFGPQGERIASASDDRTIRIWDAASGELIHSLTGHQDVVTASSFRPDGLRLVTGGADDTIRIWDLATWEQLLVLDEFEGGVHGVDFSSDGERIVSCSTARSVILWESSLDSARRIWGSVAEAATSQEKRE